MRAKIDLISIVSADLPAMRDFYRDVMGFPVQLELGGDYVEFASEGVRFALTTLEVMSEATEGHPGYARARRGQFFELAFPCESPEEVDEDYARIVKQGALPIRPPEDMPWGQRAAFFADPDGNIHELFAPL
ncbi:MAG: VOC family protein [Anaerolineaceae bacterium]|jgi:catechol 2,3-dioxygenase-like lactoylglutathione lyase family enzyme|nr:VOC family protein [Anaerolineaceae bacterium]